MSQQTNQNKSPAGMMSGRGRGGPGGVGIDEKPRNFKSSIGKLIRYMGSYKIAVAVVFAMSIVSSAFAVIGPSILGRATDSIWNSVEQSLITQRVVIDYNTLAMILVSLSVLYVISSAFLLVQGFAMTHISNQITYKLRKDISEKINRLPISYFDNNSTGNVLSIITNDVDTINGAISQTISQLIGSVVLLVGTVVIMLEKSLIMSGIALLVIPASMFTIKAIVKFSQPLYKRQQSSLGEINGHIEEMFASHILIKSYNMEEESLEKFERLNDILYENSWKSRFASHIMMPTTEMISNVGYVLVCVVGAYLTVSGQMTIGSIQAFTQYIKQLNRPIQQMANVTAQLQSAVACAERIFDFLEQEEQQEDAKEFKSTENIKGNIEFKNVSFGYTTGNPVIKNFNFSVSPGEKIAIVGPTGAGKTTLVKLLMRYYEIDSGAITIDGVNINEFKRNDLRSMFGMVLQETWLFKGTIRENLIYSNKNADEQNLYRCAKISQVHHFVNTLPDGYDFELNEESSNISQGQKQLITIARAFLQNPKMLILDEATSSVDTRTEVLIQRAMQKLMEGRTSFVIAHRLSTVKDSDKIIVMDNGDIVETGNHEELLKKGGFYAKLYASQFENAQEQQ